MPARAGEWRAWTPAEEAELAKHIADERFAPWIARAMNRTVPAIRNKAGALGLSLGLKPIAPFEPQGATMTRPVAIDPATVGVTVTAPMETEGESAEDFLARVLRRTGSAVEKAKAEPFVTLRIASDQPIALSLSSDWHLTGNGATDVQGLIDYADAIRETPRCYALSVGDLLDNPVKHRPQNPLDVPDELRLLDILVGKFGGKLLGATSGNHDDWSFSLAGTDHLKTMAEKHRVHYAPDCLIYVVEIVDPADVQCVTARWVIATRHKYYRHSNLNHSHACWRWLEDWASQWPMDAEGRTLIPDVLAIGHNHVATVETRSFPNGERVACRMGPWQKQSGFSRAGGWATSSETAPTVILWPTRKGGLQAFSDYRKAIDALKGL